MPHCKNGFEFYQNKQKQALYVPIRLQVYETKHARIKIKIESISYKITCMNQNEQCKVNTVADLENAETPCAVSAKFDASGLKPTYRRLRLTRPGKGKIKTPRSC